MEKGDKESVEELELFRKYLWSCGYRLTTISGYVSSAGRFISWLKKEGLNLEESGYSDLLKWVGYQQGLGLNSQTINHGLLSLRHYYKSVGLASPGAELRLRGHRHRLLSEGVSLLSEEDLLVIYESYEAGGLSGKRNKAMLGMLIWQGIRRNELERLRVSDIDLEAALVRVPATGVTNSRILEISGRQLEGLQDYIYQVRPLLNEGGSDRLFISMRKGKKLANSLSYLMTQLKKKNGKKNTAMQLRQSVIHEWLKKYDVREVQYMSGHKNVSSTARYQSRSLEALQDRIEEVHPLSITSG